VFPPILVIRWFGLISFDQIQWCRSWGTRGLLLGLLRSDGNRDSGSLSRRISCLSLALLVHDWSNKVLFSFVSDLLEFVKLFHEIGTKGIDVNWAHKTANWFGGFWLLEAVILCDSVQRLEFFLKFWVLSTFIVNWRYEALASIYDIIKGESLLIRLLFQVLLGKAVDFLFSGLVLG
jgi:hypothetical protein